MADPAGFERANYVRTLMSWSSMPRSAPARPDGPRPGPSGGRTAR